MRWYSKIAAAALAAVLQACATAPAVAPQVASSAAPVEQRAPVTILVSIDGFRADYLDRGVTPVLSGLARQGVWTAMRPSFPSKTFPNHYTLVTGLRPDRNGIVANRFEDPTRPGETFTMANVDPFYWNQGTPIWVAAEQAGIRTATMFWPGSNSPVHGVYPNDWQQFSQEVTGRQRVDAVIDWLRRPAATRPRLLTVYFDTLDTAGHHYGPDAPQTNQAVAEVDALVGRLVAGLRELNQPANLVIVSDHGMAALSPDRIVRLDQMVPPDSIRVIEEGPYAAFAPVPGHEAEVAAALARPHPHVQCWPREQIPERFHYGHNPRVAPWICLGDTGWAVMTRPLQPGRPFTGGNHGWDNQSPEMQALFIATGPAIRPAGHLPPFDNVDVEPLLRALIGLPQQQDIDGTVAPFENILIH